MEKFQTPMFGSGIANKGLYQFSNRRNSFYSVTKKKEKLFLKAEKLEFKIRNVITSVKKTIIKKSLGVAKGGFDD